MSHPTEPLEELRAGNRRFAGGASRDHFGADRRASAEQGQTPWAIIVGCSDSRVPAAASLASIRFAVQKLGARTVVVLGHEDCGAVAAALAGDAPEWLAPIMDHISIDSVDPSAAPADAEDALLAAAVDEHVRDTVAALNEAVAEYGLDAADRVTVAGAAYKLASGEVHWID